MASTRDPAPPEATASKVKPFSDEEVCCLQLCNIYLELAPKYLLTMLEQYVVLCNDFKEPFGKKDDDKVVWGDDQKSWLVARMKQSPANFTNKEATDSPVAEWDVSALCAALLAVSIPKDIAEEVKKVRESRNTIFHGKMASRDDLKPNVETVQNLKPHLDAVWNLKPHVMAVWNLIQSVGRSFPDHPWDDYLKELDSAADTKEFRKKFTNAEGVTELQKKVEHMIEGVQKCGEEGKQLRKELEGWRSDLNDRLEVMQRELKDIKKDIGEGFAATLEAMEKVTNLVKDLPSQLCQPKVERSQLCLVWHPLENEFKLFIKDFLSVLQREQLPSLEDLKNYCCYMMKPPDVPLRIVEDLRNAQNYKAVVEILFENVCNWLSFSLLQMIMDYFEKNLSSPRQKLKQYMKHLKKKVEKAFHSTEKALIMKVMDGYSREEVARCKLSAKCFNLEDVRKYQAFICTIVKIPKHLCLLISVETGSLLLVMCIPEELNFRVVQRVEEAWRELWRGKVENIEVQDKKFDLLQKSNEEKATILSGIKSVVAAAGPWEDDQGVLSSFGTRLYEEYGRHESLQSCVRKHREAGCKSPEDLGALEWLLCQHTPEVAESEDRDPLDVLLTTVLLSCCDVEGFVKAVVRCLEDDPAVGGRLREASMVFKQAALEFDRAGYPHQMQLPDEVVTKLYLKYCHIPSLQASVYPGVKDPQHLSHEEAGKVIDWLMSNTMTEEKWTSLPLALVEAGVTEKEMQPGPTQHHGTWEAKDYYEPITEHISRIQQLLKMRRSFPHSQEDVRAIQNSFRRYLAPISPDHLLQAATSQKRDIFQLFLDSLEEQKVDPEPYKSYLREKVPPHYQQDLEQAFMLAAAVAMTTSTTPREIPMPEAALGSLTIIPSHVAEVEKQFKQLQVADELLLTFSSAPKIKALSEKLAHSPLFMEQKESDMLLSAEDSSYIINHLDQLCSWYEVSLLQLVTKIQLRSKALEELNHFVMTRDDSLQYTSLPDCLPKRRLRDVQPLTHTPSYASSHHIVRRCPDPTPTPTHTEPYALLQLTLPSCPEHVFMGHLWSLKEQLCSALDLQPYALLLKGCMEGSTCVIFYISRHVSLDEEQVAAMFVGAKQAGLYPHSITTGLATPKEVEHRLLDVLPANNRGKVRGQMEGLGMAGKEQQSATDTAQQ